MNDADRKRIDVALNQAESGTSSRIALRIVPDTTLDAFERARSEFLGRGMDTHPSANAALILVAPKARTFAVLGGQVLHERVGQAFWDETVAKMTATFKSASPTDAIILGIERLGVALHQHFTLESP